MERKFQREASHVYVAGSSFEAVWAVFFWGGGRWGWGGCGQLKLHFLP